MRRGRLLAENSPEELLVQHNLETLEEVFLKLCMSDSSLRAAALAGSSSLNTVAIESSTTNLVPSANVDSKPNIISNNNNNNTLSANKNNNNITSLAVYDKKPGTTNGSDRNTGQVVDRFKSPVTSGAKKEKKSLTFNEYWSTTMALFWKNCTRLRRNIPVLLFQFALPAIQVILFCICIGADPFNIPVAIVNEEDPPFLSKLFLEKLDPYLVHQVSLKRWWWKSMTQSTFMAIKSNWETLLIASSSHASLPLISMPMNLFWLISFLTFCLFSPFTWLGHHIFCLPETITNSIPSITSLKPLMPWNEGRCGECFTSRIAFHSIFREGNKSKQEKNRLPKSLTIVWQQNKSLWQKKTSFHELSHEMLWTIHSFVQNYTLLREEWNEREWERCDKEFDLNSVLIPFSYSYYDNVFPCLFFNI